MEKIKGTVCSSKFGARSWDECGVRSGGPAPWVNIGGGPVMLGHFSQEGGALLAAFTY